ncbi:MAG: ADP-ribosyl-[dinitrogen reductase] hydrolase [Rhodocyclaceae bacterium]|jgi:ADP-ribosyl-[dinitrogen reductase] hydrolase|nr:ADP-ribosyl-[dinitrogen reductase] hydrolase [Rhodocyclaceae bacterium]
MNRPVLQERAVAAYLGLALGDALGATVEFLTPREIAQRHARQGGVHREITGGGWLNLRPGQVTDDTTMALALGAAILEEGGRVQPRAVANAFDGWMRARPVDMGNTVRRGIVHFRRTGEPWVEPSADAGNGAAMRCLPVALARVGADPEARREAALAQAWVTHRNPLSDEATCTLVTMLDLALGGADKAALLAQADRLALAQRDFAWRGRPMANPSGYIVDTMLAVFQALAGTEGFEDCLVEVVNRGGDADTTGAIAGMLAGALYGPAALPARWLDRLEPATRQACESQARALIDL